MKHFQMLLVVFGALVLTACSITAPKRVSEKSSAIGLTVESVPPAGAIFSRSLDSVIFIRLHGDGEYDYTVSFRPIPSNFSRGDQIYLLNAKPGRYAVIIGRHTMRTQLGTSRYSTYFPEEILKVSEVNLPPNKFVFMGNYKIDGSMNLKNMDPMQSYFIDLFEPDQRSAAFLTRALSRNYSYRGKILEANRDRGAEVKFLINALDPQFSLDTFKESGWEILLKKRLAELK